MQAPVALLFLAPLAAVHAQSKVDFARDVQPILSDNCYRCHGPDGKSRKAGLRLDSRAGALADLGGHAAVVPGQPAASHLWMRITAQDPGERMPPPKTGKTLTAAEIATLRAWIEHGAPWGEHWSFVPPRRPAVPVVQLGAVHNPIDRFVQARLREHGVRPAPPADRRTLIRRVTYDLTGLPPTPEAVAAFVSDAAPGAFERVVDRLLGSPHYGERMAMVWLDAARYADTDGFQADATRSNWPWRDWVIDAYNANEPFDEMTRRQFAGDLLPAAPPESILATCFHRNHMTNGEGGRDPEESRVEYVIDRVNTVGTVYLGMTLGCAQCHDHKFDPVSQREYYGLNAFFDSIHENGRAGGGAVPFLNYRSSKVGPGLARSAAWLAQQRAALAAVEKRALAGFADWLGAHATAVAAGFRASYRGAPIRSVRATHGSAITAAGDGTLRVAGPNPRHEDYIVTVRPELPRITGLRLHVLPATAGGTLALLADGHFILTNLKVSVRAPGQRLEREVAIAYASADYQHDKTADKAYGPVRDVLDDDPRTGWATYGADATQPRTAVFGFAEPLVLAVDEELVVELRHRSLRGHSNIRRFRLAFTSELGPAIRRVGATPREQLAAVGGDVRRLDAKARAGLRAEFLAGHAEVAAARAAARRATRRHDSYKRANRPVKVMVLARRPKPRQTHVLERGVWDAKGAVVTPHVPAALGTWPQGVARDRAGLAEWLVSGHHPLTARVAVNRYWQMYLGAGLVRTPEDFGLQGERPTHPELLDWLATEFVASGWDIRHMQRLIVTSATYRQSAALAPALRDRDPQNRWLARAARFRLPAWMIRDGALAASGLLSRRIGGPPVYPYQPPGVWQAFTMGRFRYEASVGDDVHRRSIYSFWRRLVAPTGMFDASRRRSCQIRVIRTNTPLQALTLMNDVTFVEAARVLAARTMRAQPGTAERMRAMFEQVLARLPSAAESRAMLAQLAAVRAHYADRTAVARSLLRQGSVPPATGLDVVEHAAFTVLATTILNLDETVTRE